MNKKIAVYVVYNPNLNLLSDSLESIYRQVDHIVIINNSPKVDISFCTKMFEHVSIFDRTNVGIAAAQNFALNVEHNL